MPDVNKDRIACIEELLTKALSPTAVSIIDDSHLHTGHAEAKKHGGGHFGIKITSAVFAEKTTLERHRMIYQVLDKLLKTEIHALRIISAQTPAEAIKSGI